MVERGYADRSMQTLRSEEEIQMNYLHQQWNFHVHLNSSTWYTGINERGAGKLQVCKSASVAGRVEKSSRLPTAYAPKAGLATLFILKLEKMVGVISYLVIRCTYIAILPYHCYLISLPVDPRHGCMCILEELLLLIYPKF